MVNMDFPVKKEYNEAEILKAVYEKIGGKPADFYKATVTKVHSDSFRINIYDSTPGGELGFIQNHKIIHSVFYVLPNG